MHRCWLVIVPLIAFAACTPASERRRISFNNGDQLLAAAKQLRHGDTRHEVVNFLGWRTDQGAVNAIYIPVDDPNGGRLLHPALAFWHWQVYPVSLYVDFTHDARIYRIRYYDDRREPDSPYLLLAPNQGLQLTGDARDGE